MTNCPNCGAEVVDGATTCANCGAALGGGDRGAHHQEQGGHEPQDGQGGRQPRGGRGGHQQQGGRGGRQAQGGRRREGGRGGRGGQQRQGRQQPQQGRGQQPAQGRQPQGQPGQGPGGQPPGGPGGGGYAGGGGQSRRDLLKYGAGAAIVLGGGAVDFTMLTGPGGGPAGTVRQFYSALDSGNIERAQDLIHSDSPMAGSLGGSGFGSDMMEQADISVQSTEVLEESENTARVRANISVSIMGSSEVQESTIELRTENGSWKLYGSSGGGGL